ncbi:MAG: DUF2339 domain-containing protein [Pedosphaera sp.]|nr:DUF2339 domain-containing protein [Pedosphaera sp.]
MEGFVILLVLGIIVIVLVLPIVAVLKANRATKETERLNLRLYSVERRLAELSELPPQPAPVHRESATAAVEILAQTEVETELIAQPEISKETAQQTPEPISAPPIVEPFRPTPPPLPMPNWASKTSSQTEPASQTRGRPAFSFEQVKGSLNWEQFMGAKLYAWIGGITLFLAVAYFVKLSFDRGWLPPEVRVAMGFLLGLGLVVGGVVMRQKEFTILSHTFCATGVLILYGVTFACRAIYHFAFFGPGPTFALMVLVTATAFLLAVRLEALVVAVLGMLGGFVTPILLSTGQDAPVGFFAYIALLDVGVIAVALRQRWNFLTPLAAAGTVFMQIGWASKFFNVGGYYEGSKTLIPMAVLLSFNLIWLGATKLARRNDEQDHLMSGSTAGLGFVAFLFAFYFQSFAGIAERPWLLLGFVFGLNLIILALSRIDRAFRNAYPMAGAAVFIFLSIWMSTSVTNSLLPAALTFTLVFALAHTLLPLTLQRLNGGAEPPPKWAMLFPPVALLALLIPVFRLSELTILIWPVILLVDVLAVALAAMTLSVLPVAATLLLTLLAAVGVLFKVPAELTGLPTLLVVIAACAVFFAVAGIWLRRKWPASTGTQSLSASDELNARFAAQIPAFAIVLPFVLLVMIAGRLQLWNPSPVFGLALLLVGMLFAVTRMFRLPWLPLIGLTCVAALEYAWHLRLFKPETASTPLLWYLAFFTLFAAFPFVSQRQFANVTGPWIASALAGPAQFYLVHQLVKSAWPNNMMGLLAAAFAVPALASLVAVLKTSDDKDSAKQTQLALYGGAALFFITLIFPLQFSRQWITISWAVEGAALCWLFHRVPHPGLRLTAVGLLITSFARLALNPAVLSYHARSETPIFNWYLYSYGVVTVALFMAARLLAPPRDQVLGNSAPGVLNTLGAILAFLLLNIQIADFFTAPGAAVLTFQFSGNFARDMSYSIAWALFALAMLVVGLVRQLAPARYAALALLGVTIVKLFFHDLSRLDTPYRVGALAAVAFVAFAASFLYQKFISNSAKSDEK